MSAFAAEWLALREPYDKKARNPAVLEAAVASVAGHPSVTISDLGCGTGSTLRALSPLLPARQTWRLIDNDLSLLARVPVAASPRVTALPTPLDLSRDLEAALDGPVDLVTASALLDLVSDDWLDRLAIEIAARKIPLYAALIYDGRVVFDPADPGDSVIVASVNSHQRSDKGFGSALGPAAARTAITRLETVGYAVMHGTSDWIFGPSDRDIQMEILSGWATAARETGEVPFAEIIGWLERRREVVAAGRSSIRVGHVDIFAQPTGTR
jgi:hypothetical protein